MSIILFIVLYYECTALYYINKILNHTTTWYAKFQSATMIINLNINKTQINSQIQI